MKLQKLDKTPRAQSAGPARPTETKTHTISFTVDETTMGLFLAIPMKNSQSGKPVTATPELAAEVAKHLFLQLVRENMPLK